MQPAVRISDIGQYLRCPRLVYFDALSDHAQRPNPTRIILRELILAAPDWPEDLLSEEHLAKEVEKAGRELLVVYRKEIDAKSVDGALGEVGALIPQIARALLEGRARTSPCLVDLDLRSDSLGLTGRLDRLVTGDDLLPSLIRMGKSPDSGVWKRDRLALTGYAMLVEEAYEREVDHGLVEYPLSGAIRDVTFRSIDRRRVLRIRDRIRQIKEGQLPDRTGGAPCEGCAFRENCDTRRSLASKFF